VVRFYFRIYHGRSSSGVATILVTLIVESFPWLVSNFCGRACGSYIIAEGVRYATVVIVRARFLSHALQVL